jgi:HEAT repeat protein
VKPDDAPLVAKDLTDSLAAEKESRVRREIAVAVGRYPQVAKLAVTALTDALTDPEPATRAAVAEALAQAGREGKPAAAGLAPLLADPDKAVRRAAVAALGRITPEGATAVSETMAGMLAAEKDLDLRFELVTSLGLLGESPPAVVRALAGLLADPEDELRRRSARTLALFGTGAAPAADALLKAASGDKLKDIRVDAVRAFGAALGPDLKGRIKDVLGLMNDPDFEVRMAAAEEVGALGNALKDDAETMKFLRAKLSDPHVKVREAVAAAVRKIEKKPDPKKDP